MALSPICMRCGIRRTDVSNEWVETRRNGRSTHQIDCGNDFMFPGLLVGPAAHPCPRCDDAEGHVALVGGDSAGSIGSYIEKELWPRA